MQSEINVFHSAEETERYNQLAKKYGLEQNSEFLIMPIFDQEGNLISKKFIPKKSYIPQKDCPPVDLEEYVESLQKNKKNYEKKKSSHI